MSEDTPISLTLITKIVGLILIILGATIAYFASDAPAGVISNFSGIFVGLAAVVAVVGFGLLLLRGQ
jgi:uncharacterized membrane protein